MEKKVKQILVLNSEFPPIGGGGSPVSFDMANYLSKTGEYSVDVVTSGFKTLPEYEEVNQNFRIHRVKCLRKKKEAGYPWEQVTYLISAFFKVWQLIKTKKFDFCHVHFIVPTGALAYLINKLWKIPYVITSHGSDIIGYNKRADLQFVSTFIKIPWKMIVDSAKYVTVPSNFLKQKLISTYPKINKEKIKLIYNIIEEGRFYEAERKIKQIFLISRLQEHKGVHDFITAIKGIDLNGWKVVIAGDGPQRAELELQVKNDNLAEYVTFVGWLELESKRKYYAESEIFVNPSHKESFGITTVEAILSGCTIVASNTGIVSDLNNVYIFEPKDTTTLSSMLKLAMQKPLKSESSSMFNSAIVMAKFINLLENNE
jgi:glycosyltransferase involved in cell wall biosynthesis